MGVALVERFAADVAWTQQDLSFDTGANAVIEQTLQKWGKVDILVDNAGGGIIHTAAS